MNLVQTIETIKTINLGHDLIRNCLEYGSLLRKSFRQSIASHHPIIGLVQQNKTSDDNLLTIDVHLGIMSPNEK